MSEEPSWLSRASSKTGGAGSPSSRPVAGTAGATQEPPPFKNVVTGTFLIINLGLMVFMAATGALGVGQSNGDPAVIFVGIYLIVFAGIEFIHEIAQIIPYKGIDELWKKNFGFLYGPIGKGLYFELIGLLTFGLSTPRSLAIACGVLIAAWGPFTIICWYFKPQYFDVKEKYVPE